MFRAGTFFSESSNSTCFCSFFWEHLAGITDAGTALTATRASCRNTRDRSQAPEWGSPSHFANTCRISSSTSSRASRLSSPPARSSSYRVSVYRSVDRISKQLLPLDKRELAPCCRRANSRCCLQVRERTVIRFFAPHPCGSQSCHWRDRRQHPGHDVLDAGGSLGGGNQ